MRPNSVFYRDDAAKSWLTEKGYDKLYGARPMGRLIQEKIKQPLAEELLFGKLAKGGVVLVRLKGNKLTFDFPKVKGNKFPVKRRKGKVPALIDK